jgi:hypothetical protein
MPKKSGLGKADRGMDRQDAAVLAVGWLTALWLTLA